MIYEIPTTHELKQTQNFNIFDMELELTLKYNEVGAVWQFDLTDLNANKILVFNKGLAVNAPSLINKNLPFVLMLVDTTKSGVNCVDFSELGERLKLYAVSKKEFNTAMSEIAKDRT
ncbi:phage baseplate plug protein [Campylobacter concisus]|uniref:phage baseplate plug family protein n=1 Tax=Campylobacter concisus TaxID=199 RepID=UPI000D2F7201|nr:hypothetical protein [Campylobacter concisus]